MDIFHQLLRSRFFDSLLGVRNMEVGVTGGVDPSADHADRVAVILKLSKTSLKVSTSLSE